MAGRDVVEHNQPSWTDVGAHWPGRLHTLPRAAIRAVDRLAVEQLGLPSLALMEQASRAVSDVAIDLLMRDGVAPAAAKVVVLAGGGNNGGDGYTVARLLRTMGVTGVTILAAKDVAQLGGDAGVQARVARSLRIPMMRVADAKEDADALAALPETFGEADLVVDALLGVGFRGGEIRSPMDQIIHAANAANAVRLAIDTPSGLDCDSGTSADPALVADVTVTFVARKPGFANSPHLIGELIVTDIGLPWDIVTRFAAEGHDAQA